MTNSPALLLARHMTGRVQFKAKVLETMLRYRQTRPKDTEAGGILLGRLIIDSDDIVIDHATTPKKRDIRTRTRFIRDQMSHQRIVDRAWRCSLYTCHYLGEWHTHPENDPVPSKQDLRNWNRIMAKSVLDYDVLFFVIVGIRTIRIWEGNVKDRIIHELAFE